MLTHKKILYQYSIMRWLNYHISFLVGIISLLLLRCCYISQSALLQQRTWYIRVVFLGESGSRIGSAGGTGVFIPHATNTLPNHHLRKKPRKCSRVIITERLLHSLKKHHGKTNASQATQAHPNAMFHARPNQRLQHQETPNKTAVNRNKNGDNNLMSCICLKNGLTDISKQVLGRSQKHLLENFSIKDKRRYRQPKSLSNSG